MGVACSFIATLILCAWDSFRWRKSNLLATATEDEDAPAQAPLHDRIPWWQIAIGIVFGLTFLVLLFPVLLGALPALCLYVFLARVNFSRRITNRALRRRHVILAWLVSFMMTPYVMFLRWRRMKSRFERHH
jgi:hypothetical protein